MSVLHSHASTTVLHVSMRPIRDIRVDNSDTNMHSVLYGTTTTGARHADFSTADSVRYISCSCRRVTRAIRNTSAATAFSRPWHDRRRRIPYGLLPSTPILSSTGPRPAPIPRAAQRFSVPHSMAQYYATTAAPSAEAHSQQSSAAVASSEPTVEKSIGMEASPAEEGIQVTSEQQHQLWTAPQEIERARTPEEADLSAVDNHRNGDHGSQASSTARDSTRPDDNGHAGEPGDTG
jgi:hypothetical protein